MHRVAAMDEEAKTEEATAKLQAAIEQVGVLRRVPAGFADGELLLLLYPLDAAHTHARVGTMLTLLRRCAVEQR